MKPCTDSNGNPNTMASVKIQPIAASLYRQDLPTCLFVLYFATGQASKHLPRG